MSLFEFRLPDEVLQDLIAPGKVCKHDLTVTNNVVGQYGTDSASTGLSPSVQLEKLNDSVVRLWITVHRSKEAALVEFGSQTVACENWQIATQTSNDEWTKPGDTQTNNAEFVQVVTTQTDSSGSDVAITQTDGSGLQMTTTQTDGSGLLHGTTQTSIEEWTKQGNTQTNSAEFSHVGVTQTDGSGMLFGRTQTDGTGQLHGITQTENVVSKAIITQTDAFAIKEGAAQTDNTEWLFAASTQTDNSFCLVIGSTQTDKSEWLCVEATQTSSAEWHTANFTQWDSSDWVTSCSSQTDGRLVESFASQTIESRIGQTFASTGVETSANLSTQRNTDVQATTDVSDSQCQATVTVIDAPTQASVNTVNGDVQTELSLAWRSEQEVQATVEMIESTSQVTVETTESTVQAVVTTSESTAQAVAETAEAAGQAVVDVVESEIQTVYLGVSSDCQTTVSMALELDCGVQVSAEMLIGTSQTDQFITDSSSSQTEIIMSQQVDGEVQAVAELKDSQTECDIAPPFPKIESSSSETELPSSQGSVANQTLDEFSTSLLSQSVVDASFSTAVEHHLTIDGSSQTDPVTIIIGDASFLVKKLKSSAVSPSKVVTYGNEIEIEVNPDIAGDSSRRGQMVGAAPIYEEKENDTVTKKTVAMQSFQSPSGVMVRGSPGAGPRLRMPVSGGVGAVQHQRVVSTRTPGGLLVRHPVALSPNSVVSPRALVSTPPTPVRGPQPVAGGSMSCPFCALGFIDSAALYEHLSNEHTVDQKTKWKQPKGREGKTIVPQKRTDGHTASGATGSGEPAPPILTPIEPYNVSAAGVKYRSPMQSKPATVATVRNTSAVEAESAQDSVLFEDPVEPAAEKKQRGRQQKSEGETEFSNQFSPPPAKRLRATNENDDDDADEDEEAEKTDTPVRKGRGRLSAANNKETKKTSTESPQSASASRRGGRTPKSQKK